ncbi:beta-1,3-glucanase family protein [Luteibacter sp. CQ10]|uniref:beta-1,3-glucanase family protein n=1 Tax=Luteibacter sp. CQ10 TaxID=2805821 RepID=UPI0034A48BC6
MKHPASPPSRTRRKPLASVAALVLMGVAVSAQAVTLAPSDRQDINIGARPWKYTKQHITNPNDPVVYADVPNGDAGAAVNFDDSKWLTVGLPHAANDFTTFINQESGGGQGSLDGETSWYRNRLTDSASMKGKKVMLELEGAHTGDRVYVNGQFIPGTGVLNQPGQPDAQATHVIGFIPHIVDLTPYLRYDGTDVIAVKVSRSGGGFFEDPGFSGSFRFGQSEAGIFRPAYLHVTNLVHIPENVYAGQNTWGTYVGTKSLSTDLKAATVEVQTNVVNETDTPQTVTLVTQIVDANGNEVARDQQDRTLAPHVIPSDQTPVFDETLTVNNPTLWYPNNSTEGKPYLYRVFHTVSINGVVVDAKQSTLGIRMLTWDKDFLYVNGKKQYVYGGSSRYDYPGLGSSVPEEQQWRDLKDMAAMGGNLFRVGHSLPSPEFVAAADALGVFLVQPSGDGEGGFGNTCAAGDGACNDMWTIKREVQRDTVIRDRSHPSILAWEINNGTMDTPFAQELGQNSKDWDNIAPRAIADRTPKAANGDILSCSKAGCETHVHQVDFPNKPAWGAEYWGPGGKREGYDTELAFALNYLTPWSQARKVGTFGMAQWYFADTPGEVIELVDGTEDDHWVFHHDDKGNPTFHPDGKQVKDFTHNARGNNASMADANRFPRMLYYIYESVWTPFEVKPMVKLANTWNRSGDITVSAFSNCPAVRLLVNGVQQGTDQVPNSWDSIDDAAFNALNGPVSEDTGHIQGVATAQATTKLPGQVHWNVTWQAGSAVAQCIGTDGLVVQKNGADVADTLKTAGAADHIELTVVNTADPIVKPDGSVFQVTANGSDATFIVAKVVDANGVRVPDASQLVTFNVDSGESLVTFNGGTQQLVDWQGVVVTDRNGPMPEPNHYYHSPGSHELKFEGGLQKIALRSKFTPGTVTVSATSAGLKPGVVSFTIAPIPAPPAAGGTQIIANPTSQSLSTGDHAHFTVVASSSHAVTYTWKKDGVEIAGATGPSFDTPALTLADNNTKYTVVVHGEDASPESQPAVLSVVSFAPVHVTKQPVAVNVDAGQTAHFAVTASGSPTIKYQWMKGSDAIAGANGPTYDTPVLSTNDNGAQYSVVVSNQQSSEPSVAVTLTVNAARPPVVSNTLASVRANPGQPATFDATNLVAGSSPFHYKWSHDGVPVGGDSPKLTIQAVRQGDVGTYSVEVSNIAGTAAPVSAQLTLAPPGANLALQKVTTSTALEDNVGLAAWHAVDGDDTTRWGSAHENDESMTVDLGSSRTFNRVVLKWENAYADEYAIQYSDSLDDASFKDALHVTDGSGGTDDRTFDTPVKGRYVRMKGIKRHTDYGYSLYEFQVYNTPSCCTAADRYSVDATNKLVTDNLSGLVWDQFQRGFADQGAQFTQLEAIKACTAVNARLPSIDEAVAIAGTNNSTSAFPGSWRTWTAGNDPNNPTFATIVGSDGSKSTQVLDNFPGNVVCVRGAEVKAPTITAQPTDQTAGVGRSAHFDVAATGDGPLTYDWYTVTTDANGQDVLNSLESTPDGSYHTKALTAAQNGTVIRVNVISAKGLLTASRDIRLTVDGSNTGFDPDFGGAAPQQPGNGNDGGNNGGNTGGDQTGGSQPGTDGKGGKTITHGATAFSSVGFERGDLSASAAIDGDMTSRWSSTPKVDPADLAVDFGTPKTFDHVIERWENASSARYTIDVSDDGKAWTTVAGPIEGHGGVETQKFAAVTKRYVRMNSEARNTDYGNSMFEFEVYAPAIQIVGQPQSQSLTEGQTATFTVGTQAAGNVGFQWRHDGTAIANATQGTLTFAAKLADAGSYDVVVSDANGNSVTSNAATLAVQPVQQQPTDGGSNGSGTGSSNGDLALNRPVLASDEENPVAFKASNANDGDAGTRWSSGFTDDQWIRVDLGSVKTVNKVVLSWENAHATDYLIEVSVDGSTWQTAFSKAGSQGGVETLTFPDKQARYVRMHGGHRSTQYGYSLWSFEVYGSGGDDTSGGQPTDPSTNDPTTGFDYDVYPGFIGTTLRNATNGKWRDDQIFIAVLGRDPSKTDATGQNVFSWVKPDGTLTAMKVEDNDASNHLTKNGQNYPNYFFTLAQAKLAKLPMMDSGRIYVSVGEPMYMKVLEAADGTIGIAGPNPLNGTDPNLGVTYDWMEYTWNKDAIFVNTTQVDQFSLPLSLDLYSGNKTRHANSGITQTRAQIFSEYNQEVPAEFQIADTNALRILAPGKDAFDSGKPQAHYFDAYIDQVWSHYTDHTLTMNIGNQVFEGTVVDGTLVFHHTNWADGHNGDEPEGMAFNVSKPTTQAVFECKDALASGHDPWGFESQLEAQICAAFNRHVMEDTTKWKDPSAYYQQAPANYYSRFWHVHGVDQKAYGFAYDDVNDQESLLADPQPEHMDIGIGW